MADAGLSTLGVEVWQAETNGEKITNSSLYSQLTRINAMGEVTVTPENIDASALEDLFSRYVAGRSTLTDALAITVNATNETIAEWKKILGKKICVQTIIPGLTDAFFVIVTVPTTIPQPAFDQNGLLTFVMNCTVNDFIGLSDKVEPTETDAESGE